MLTQEYLKELLHYDPLTGIFVWIACRLNGKKSGEVAGWIDNGYVKISIDNKNYRAHRLAWLYVYGVWPTKHIDHRDHHRSNNRIDNLRDVTQTENNQNQLCAYRNNKLGILGVCFHKAVGKYEAKISINNKQISLGFYKTPEDAEQVYLKTKREVHSTCTI